MFRLSPAPNEDEINKIYRVLISTRLFKLTRREVGITKKSLSFGAGAAQHNGHGEPMFSKSTEVDKV